MDALNTFCEGLFFYLDVFSLPTSLSGVSKVVLGGLSLVLNFFEKGNDDTP